MNNRFIKQTLVALAVSGLGMIASTAHAEHERFENRHTAYTSHFPDRDFDERHDRWHDRNDFRHSEDFLRRVEARQDRQMSRIFAGKRSGELTRDEFRGLMRDQREIRFMKAEFLADGYLDRREFLRLERAQDRASQAIRAERHDHQARSHRGGHAS